MLPMKCTKYSSFRFPLDKKYKLLAQKFSLKLLNNYADCPELFTMNLPNVVYKTLYIFLPSISKKLHVFISLLCFDVSRNYHKKYRLFSFIT